MLYTTKWSQYKKAITWGEAAPQVPHLDFLPILHWSKEKSCGCTLSFLHKPWSCQQSMKKFYSSWEFPVYADNAASFTDNSSWTSHCELLERSQILPQTITHSRTSMLLGPCCFIIRSGSWQFSPNWALCSIWLDPNLSHLTVVVRGA